MTFIGIYSYYPDIKTDGKTGSGMFMLICSPVIIDIVLRQCPGRALDSFLPSPLFCLESFSRSADFKLYKMCFIGHNLKRKLYGISLIIIWFCTKAFLGIV